MVDGLLRNVRAYYWLVLPLIVVAAWQTTTVAQATLRPPAVPLVTHDPYFSIWSAADRLSDTDTTHWTGKPHRLRSLVRIDSKTFRIMGREPAQVPGLPQRSLEVLPTRTVYTFEGQGVQVTLMFTTPQLPNDLDVLSRPLSYLTWELRSADGRPHEVAIYFDASAELSTNTPDQRATWAHENCGPLSVMKLGTNSQEILVKKGDDVRIDWGYLYVAVPKSAGLDVRIADNDACCESFVEQSQTKPTDLPPAIAAPNLRAAVTFSVDRVTSTPVSRWLMLAYDDEYSIRYFRRRLRPYWRRNGTDATALLQKGAADYRTLQHRCERFDAQLMADLRATGGEKYAQLCALVYRQSLAGNKIAADPNGMPLMFPKENFSNGCIGTVDVIYPQAPFFLLFSPALTKAMLVPVLDYAQSKRWPYPYAPHDLGTYPHACGQVYGMGGSDGSRMPVEESGNMLIMMAALSKIEGNADLARKYWPLLTLWADYLAAEGLDPVNQLCTADMFGHLAHNADLSLKAIIGIGGFAQMAARLGRQAESDKYSALARDYAIQWRRMAADDRHTRLAFDRPGTWGMKHNLIWDRILELKLFPDSVGDKEIAWYLKVQNDYGLPCDNRTEQSLIDWAVWCISLARNERDWQALFAPLYDYADQTPQRVPLPDWFYTTDAKRRGFQARPVVGGIFIKALLTGDVAKRYAERADRVTGQWAPLPAPVTFGEVVPTACTAPVRWRYSFEQPAANWFEPGFDDSAWHVGAAGFGTEQTPGAIVGTKWNTTDIWLRREFTLPDRPLKNPVLWLHYDEAPEIYINGALAAKLSGWSGAYSDTDIKPEGLAALKPGSNLMAVHASQTYGGQYIDVGLAEETKPESK